MRPTRRNVLSRLGLGAALAAVLVACNDTAGPDRRAAWISLVGKSGYHANGGVPVGWDRVVVVTLDASGLPAPHVPIMAVASHGGATRWADAAPGDTVTAGITDAQGHAAFRWDLGPTREEQTLTVSAPGAPDLVVRATIDPLLDATITVTLTDSVISVGESTRAYATITTPTGEIIPYDDDIQWTPHGETPVIAVSAEGAPYREGASTFARGPVTVTGLSAGQAQLVASVPVAIGDRASSSRAGSAQVTVLP